MVYGCLVTILFVFALCLGFTAYPSLAHPQNGSGAIMRISGLFSQFETDLFQREIANALDSDAVDIFVIRATSSRKGTGIDVYFVINNPSKQEISQAVSEITLLPGNEKMLLLYQWWITNNQRIGEVF